MKKATVTLGLDFGTESVRALLVDLRGRERASAAAKYPHGQITESLPGSAKKLSPHYALQHPLDWIQAAAKATRAALREAGLGREEGLGIRAMAAPKQGTAPIFKPNTRHRAAYNDLYREYRRLGGFLNPKCHRQMPCP